MKKIVCVLFDMDGVMIDTESQYDIFWKHTGEKYNTGIPNLEKIIKGTTLPNILKKYFSENTQSEIDTIISECDRFESQMKFPEIAGSVDFVKALKNEGITVGLVTSSTDTKMNKVNEENHFDQLFDVVITAARVEHGKPSPDCYLLAAKDLNIAPEDCIVFEDAFTGIEAAKAANMTVIGLATTNRTEELIDKCKAVIPDFNGFTISKLKELLQKK